MKPKRPACGLCGETGNLTKTPCCNDWICDDADKYVLFSYKTSSCYRNHDRYTLCSYHHKEDHSGKWQDCAECKNDFQLENYVDFATNDFNFEKLANLPKVTIKCVNCGFESNSMQDFSFQTSNSFYCNKKKCQKTIMSY
ncbi:hypothetical protein ID47_07460 [Candidatus Paracaedibacter acanthamoebae]|uniref:Uncharacterized protein n=1 Tax=Candidatus Odyssella acanthamoebae TaxID=91604 RepID=A0A077B0X7_9PROT|nr:hypothetical protein ID47_07460 [Candidatus Paracaedibacter acanthamoebae]